MQKYKNTPLWDNQYECGHEYYLKPFEKVITEVHAEKKHLDGL